MVLHQVNRYVWYHANITIIDGFISQIFVLLILLFLCFKILQYKKNEQQYLVILLLYPAQASETQVDLRDQPIVVSEVSLLLETHQYSCS